MCYTGTCPYEGRGGGCNLSHHYETGRVPADAWCSDPDEEVRYEVNNMSKMSSRIEGPPVNRDRDGEDMRG